MSGKSERPQYQPTAGILLAALFLLYATGCSPQVAATSTPHIYATELTAAVRPSGASMPTPSPSPLFTPGPPLNLLTGQLVEEPSLLDRRPVLIKVENLPRINRPQFGLNLADHVFEYYTEEGTTRFAAVYYGQNSPRVGPIRSARWVDMQLVPMYKAIFMFGRAYDDLLNAILESDFKDRLVLEEPGSCPALCRYDPDGTNFLGADLTALPSYLEKRGMDNSRQDLSGLVFDPTPPNRGHIVHTVYVKFSGAIYNRWDFDELSGRYLRHVDMDNAPTVDMEQYGLLTDQLTGQPVMADNVVVLLARYIYVIPLENGEVFDINLQGSGNGWLYRNGQVFDITWRREFPQDLVTLYGADGLPIALKPGTTWYELLHLTSTLDVTDGMVRHQLWLPAAEEAPRPD